MLQFAHSSFRKAHFEHIRTSFEPILHRPFSHFVHPLVYEKKTLRQANRQLRIYLACTIRTSTDCLILQHIDLDIILCVSCGVSTGSVNDRQWPRHTLYCTSTGKQSGSAITRLYPKFLKYWIPRCICR